MIGPCERLAAVEWSVDAAGKAELSGYALESGERWLRAISDRLGTVGVAEGGIALAIRLKVMLINGGALSCREDGGRRLFKERESNGRELQVEVVAALSVARIRLAGQVESFERIAEQAIRTAAEANLLAAPGHQPRADWLSETARRMIAHPNSGPLVVKLALSLPETELLKILDRTFKKTFAV